MTHSEPPPDDSHAADGHVAYLANLRNDFLFFIAEIWKDRRLDKFAPLGDVELDIAAWAAGGSYAPERRALSNGRLTGWSPPAAAAVRRLAEASGNTTGKFRGVLAPRKIGKTHLVTACLALWRLFRDHARRVLIISKSHGEAKKTVKLIRDWIDQVWFLQHLKPSPAQRDNRDMFDVGPAPANRQASVTALGVDGQLPGNRAHTIIPDDVETQGNTETLESREKLAETLTELKFILYGELPTDSAADVEHLLDPTEIVYTGTYHHEDSVYLKLATKGYAFRSWPILYPGPAEECLNLAPLIAERLASRKALPGQITMPHRFDQAAILDLQAEGRRAFSMQCMLLKNLAAGNQCPLRLADLMVLDLDPRQAPMTVTWGTRDHNGSTALPIPSVGFGLDKFYRPIAIAKEVAPYAGTKMWVDSSGKGEDDTGVAIVSYLNGLLFVHLCQGFTGGYELEALDNLASLARNHNVRSLAVEDNFGGGMFAQLLEPRLRRLFIEPNTDPRYPDGWACSIEDDTKVTHATRQKELRIIDALEPLASSHRMVWDTRVAQNQALQFQFTRITRQRNALGKSPNELDALAGACKLWQHALSIDPEVNAEKLRKAEELREHMEHYRESGISIPDTDRYITHRGF